MKKLVLLIFLLQLCYGSIFAVTRSICPLPGQGATFCNLSVDNFCVAENAQVGGTLNVMGLINGTDISVLSGNVFFGNTCRVDQVNGSDALGNRNGAPFQTIQAALNAAQPGDVVWIFPGTYNESIIIPPAVVVTSFSPGSVIIQQLNVTSPTDLVTIGEGAYLRDVTLLLTSSQHVQLRGIFHNAGALPSVPTVFDKIALFIDNSGAGPGSSDVYGIYMTGIGTVGFIGDFMLQGIIQVTSTGGGKKRGIYIDSPTLLQLLSPIILMFGGTDVIGLETNDPGTVVTAQSGAIGGDFFAQTPDISQTQGNISLASTYLVNSEANGLGFTVLIVPTTYIFADADNPVGAGQTLYMRPGTGSASSVPIDIHSSQKFLAKALSIHMITAPGFGESTTWTVLRNGVPTALSLTISDNNVSGIEENISVHFSKNDELALEMVTSAGAQTADVVVQVDIY